jgi:hypothetical protein
MLRTPELLEVIEKFEGKELQRSLDVILSTYETTIEIMR